VDNASRHVVLGLGGVGGLVAALLARSGDDVRAIVREETLAAYPGRLSVSSAAFGDFDVPVAANAALEEECDVLWVTVKAPQLEVAIESISPSLVRGALIIPLLNGIDHVEFLRAYFPDSRVIAASIRVATERTEPGHIIHRSGFAEVALAIDPASSREEALAAGLREAGFGVRVVANDATVLWGKLYLLAPMALATSIVMGPIGQARQDAELAPLLSAALRETWTVARAEGADIEDGDLDARFQAAMPDAMSSSLERDIRLGNDTEFQAITEPVLRCGRVHGIPTPAFAELARRVQTRIDTR
jgi:2-dehydropantoate 2-reductase